MRVSVVCLFCALGAFQVDINTTRRNERERNFQAMNEKLSG